MSDVTGAAAPYHPPEVRAGQVVLYKQSPSGHADWDLAVVTDVGYNGINVMWIGRSYNNQPGQLLPRENCRHLDDPEATDPDYVANMINDHDGGLWKHTQDTLDQQALADKVAFIEGLLFNDATDAAVLAVDGPADCAVDVTGFQEPVTDKLTVKARVKRKRASRKKKPAKQMRSAAEAKTIDEKLAAPDKPAAPPAPTIDEPELTLN